ncbi:MAG: response regulator [Geobacteraceae bacterium]|nr:response regulator [Geobacteraceae bacterium]NTW80961.1 response regulator [Geobacteraceae bacterium]
MADELQRIKVLLVDDEDNILRAIQRLLMDEDFDVETATSGEAALEKIQTLENVGLIVSDQRMPGMNGAEFLGRSREILPNTQRILLTGYSDINATIEAINKGGAGRYISKPWNDDELICAIRDAVDLYRQDAERRRLNEIVALQKEELEAWNASLKKRLLQTTATIREQNQAIKNLDESSPADILSRTFDNFFEVMGDRNAVHARTVSIMVTDVARKMNLNAETVATFRLAALLHDVGKFASHSLSLQKHQEDMSESEVSDYRQHTIRGVEMFSKVEELAGILPLIRSHHEAFDGSGFPDGLQGEDIPLGARLIAIADQIEKSAHSVNNNRAVYALMNARFLGGGLLDPQLIPRFQAITKVVYFEGRKAGIFAEVEITPAELLPGMTISRDVESGSGVLLMQRGNILDAAGIALIRSHYRKNPPADGVFVQIMED